MNGTKDRDTAEKFVLELGPDVDRNPVTLEVELRRKQNDVAPYRDIEWKECREYTDLSIVGNVWNRARTDIVSGGQNTETIRAAFPDNPRVVRLCDLWERWHLNGMSAGMRPQEEFLRAHPEARGTDYTATCKALEAAGLLEIPTGQELTPDSGPYDRATYKYGSFWLVEALPAEIEKEIRDLCADLAAEAPKVEETRDFCARHGITADTERTDRNPNMDDDGRAPMDHWRVTLKRGGARMTLVFSKGSGHKRKAPTALEVLGCCASDATDESFEDWCASYGFEAASRKAKRTYKACVGQTAKLRTFLGDLYEKFLEETQ